MTSSATSTSRGKIKPIKPTRFLTAEEQTFLLSAADWLEDFHLRNMTKAKILSRLAALGFGVAPPKQEVEK